MAAPKGHADPSQQKAFTRWVNVRLTLAGKSPIVDLATDFRSGVALAELLEALTKQTVVGKINKAPKMLVQRIANLDLSFELLEREKVRVVGVSPEDLEAGNVPAILGMLWILILKYQIGLGTSPRADLLQWVKVQVAPSSLIPADFGPCWSDGSLLTALVASLGTSVAPSLPQTTGLESLRTASDLAESKYGIPGLLDASDLAAGPDELAMMTFISFFREYKLRPPTSQVRIVVRDSSDSLPSEAPSSESPIDAGAKLSLRTPTRSTARTRAASPSGYYNQNASPAPPTHAFLGLKGPTLRAMRDSVDATPQGSGMRVPTQRRAGSPERRSVLVPNAGIVRGPKTQPTATISTATPTTTPTTTTFASPLSSTATTSTATISTATPTTAALAISLPSTSPKTTNTTKIASTPTATPSTPSPEANTTPARSTPKPSGIKAPTPRKIIATPVQAPPESLPPVQEAPPSPVHAPMKTWSEAKRQEWVLIAQQSWAEGPGLEVALVRRVNHFTVYVRGSDARPLQDLKESELSVTMMPWEDNLPTVAVPYLEHENGAYKCEYEPPMEGEYSISVLLGGEPVEGPPPSIVVRRAADAGESWVDGQGLLDAVAGRPNKFSVHVVADDGRPVVECECEVTISGHGEVLEVLAVGLNQGIYLCQYTPPLAGEYSLRVCVDGAEVKAPSSIWVRDEADQPVTVHFSPLQDTKGPSEHKVEPTDEIIAVESVIHEEEQQQSNEVSQQSIEDEQQPSVELPPADDKVPQVGEETSLPSGEIVGGGDFIDGDFIEGDFIGEEPATVPTSSIDVGGSDSNSGELVDENKEASALLEDFIGENEDTNPEELARLVSDGREAVRLLAEKREVEKRESDSDDISAHPISIKKQAHQQKLLELEKLEDERFAQAELERAESEKLENERIENERIEKERIENERIENERIDFERTESERIESERIESERIENERLEMERLENIQKEEEHEREAEQRELERKKAVIEAERELIEAEKVFSERQEMLRRKKQEEADKEAQEKEETARSEMERAEEERALAEERAEGKEQAENAAIEETERARASEAENDEREEQEREAQRKENERIEEERREAERIENERLEMELAEEEARELERIEAEKREAERIEHEKQEEIRREQEKLETERIEKEMQEIEEREATTREALRIEAMRQEADRIATEQLEARIAAERREAERHEAEERSLAQQRLEQERVDSERIAHESDQGEIEIQENEQEQARLAEADLEAEKEKVRLKEIQEEARREAERIEAEKAEREQREEEERVIMEQAAEEERIAAEKDAREQEEVERAQQEQLEKEEIERSSRERAEREREEREEREREEREEREREEREKREREEGERAEIEETERAEREQRERESQEEAERIQNENREVERLEEAKKIETEQERQRHASAIEEHHESDLSSTYASPSKAPRTLSRPSDNLTPDRILRNSASAIAESKALLGSLPAFQEESSPNDSTEGVIRSISPVRVRFTASFSEDSKQQSDVNDVEAMSVSRSTYSGCGTSKPWAEGPGLAVGYSRFPNEFVVHAFDGEGIGLTGHECLVYVVPIDSQQKKKVEVSVKDKGDGQYVCKYVTDFMGEVRISMTFDGKDVKGTPLVVSVGETPACWVEGVKTGVMGRSNKFTIHARPNGVPTPGKQFEVTLSGTGGADIPVVVNDNHNGSYTCSYYPRTRGTFVLTVKEGTTVVVGTPCSVVTRPPPKAEKSVLAVAMDAVCGKLTTCQLHVLDQDERPVSCEEYTISIQGPSAAVPVELTCKSEGVYECSYVPEEKGDYLITALLAGEHVENSPCVVVCRSAQYIPKKGDPTDEALAKVMNRQNLDLDLNLVAGRPGVYTVGRVGQRVHVRALGDTVLLQSGTGVWQDIVEIAKDRSKLGWSPQTPPKVPIGSLVAFLKGCGALEFRERLNSQGIRQVSDFIGFSEQSLGVLLKQVGMKTELRNALSASLRQDGGAETPLGTPEQTPLDKPFKRPNSRPSSPNQPVIDKRPPGRMPISPSVGVENDLTPDALPLVIRTAMRRSEHPK